MAAYSNLNLIYSKQVTQVNDLRLDMEKLKVSFATVERDLTLQHARNVQLSTDLNLMEARVSELTFELDVKEAKALEHEHAEQGNLKFLEAQV